MAATKKTTKKATTRASAKSPAKPRRSRVGITLEPRELSRIDALIDTVSHSEAAREFGVEVDRSLVLRIAVIRGLQVMEAGAASPRSVITDQSVAKPEPKKVVEESAQGPETDEPEPEKDKNGNVKPPEGWNEWLSGERIPESHEEVHEYYTKNGWRRFWGKAGDETIVFYWTGDPRLQGLALYDGKGPDKSTVLEQKVGPYGTGHLIPHSWSPN
jgi:hypothetical protein